MSTLNIVVLGAGFAGLQSAHYILQHTIPQLPKSDTYHVYLINPSKEFYHMVSAPRSVISDILIDPSIAFMDIAKGFSQYPASNFTFLQASVSSIDTASRALQYTSTEPSVRDGTLHYHALVIATGTAQSSPLFWQTPETKTARQSFRDQLATANNIIIGGGGPVAVEIAGEIGDHLNTRNASKHKATITLLTSASKLLPVLREDVAAHAETYLNSVGVTVRYNAKIAAATTDKSGAHVKLASGEEIHADMYIPAIGAKPNTGFLPNTVLTPSAHIDTNASSLRVDGAGPRVYALGDVSSASPGGILHLTNMIPVVVTNLKRDLEAFAAGKGDQLSGKDMAWVPDVRKSQFVPVGRSKGVGMLFGWKIPSLIVWAIKGRDYMISFGTGYMDGTSMKKEVVWKG
ncbi:FAD/NAD(P)-binding domain-containing protein [Microthyrium microscopicum]|uniref:FAD/NAD(P)-binding domain-containing protein n=1 Tax=Microthyrium microscopicum TaxID=703497 RepID=A0A6A6U9G3_9PEZI|nr:FAD/NAD(P)-binding domain-containing protein [Microthyrium microscopicum]